MAQSSFLVASGATNNWAGGAYNGYAIIQEFPVPYSATKTDPNGTYYVSVTDVGVWLAKYSTYTGITYRNFIIPSTSVRTLASPIRYSGTAAALTSTTFGEKKLAITTTTPVAVASGDVWAGGFQIRDANYWNQYYDSTGSTSGSYDMYIASGTTSTNTNSTVAKWGGGANWEAAANLRMSIYYDTLPVAPAAPVMTSATSTFTSATFSVSVPTDDGEGDTTSGGTAISSFRVRYSSDNGSTWTVFASDFSKTATTQNVTVTGLKPGRSYIFQVAAINSVATAASTSSSYSTSSTAIQTKGGVYSGGVWNGIKNVTYKVFNGSIAVSTTYNTGNPIISATLTSPGIALKIGDVITITGTSLPAWVGGTWTVNSVASNTSFTYSATSPTTTSGTNATLTVADRQATVKVWNGTSWIDYY